MDFEYLKDKIFKTLSFEYSGEIEFGEGDGLSVCVRDGKARISAGTPAALCRALTEFAMRVSRGETEFKLSRKQNFKWCGPMLDMSRDGVLRVGSVKKYLDMIACFGMNMLMLYTEDTFELPGYPFFGYKRGRYTLNELKEIDEYAYSLGIEVIPCVQTLGHLDKYLPWQEADAIRDTNFNLMPGSPESLEFIEAVLKQMKKAFRSENIHIGMDEASDVGLGNYYKKHRGEVIDQNALIFDHLAKVCDLCKKYGYKPMIWSDLFFPDPDSREIYTYNSRLPEEYTDKIPENIRFMYWYYSGKNKNRYLTLLKRHKETGRPIAFAGAGWNWEGFAPNTQFAFDCMIPALDACLEEDPEMILNTLWGNGGCETSFFLCHPSNALFAEYQWSDKPDISSVWSINEFVTKTPEKLYRLIDTLNYGLYGNVILGRKLLRQDILGTVRKDNDGYIQENMPDVFKNGEPMTSYRNAAAELRKYISENGDWDEYFELEAAVLETAAYKAEIYSYLQKAYKDGDKKGLERLASSVLPQCIESYKKLYSLFEKQWNREYKAFGWDVHCSRSGAQLARMDHAINKIKAYLSGSLGMIEELEEIPLRQHFIEYDTTMTD